MAAVPTSGMSVASVWEGPSTDWVLATLFALCSVTLDLEPAPRLNVAEDVSNSKLLHF